MTLNPLTPYLLKKKRLEKKLTIAEVAKTFDFDKTYLSKVENNKITPSERKLKQLFHKYEIKSYETDQLDFTEATIHHLLDRIYYVEFDDKSQSELNQRINKHQNSIYLGHLCLVEWCYKSLSGLWDDAFLSDLKSYVNLLELLTPKEQNFFLLCLMFYYVRTKQFDKYHSYEKAVSQIENREWLG